MSTVAPTPSLGEPLLLGERTWPEAGAAGRAVLLVPLGSTEQHGPHLPLDTDTRVAVAVSEGAARRRPGTFVAPAFPYGASGEHAGFPGTLSIGTPALTTALVELGRSTDLRLVLVTGHGGNLGALRDATALLVHEGRDARWWAPCVPGGDPHAGRTETSLLLAIAPHLVRLDRAEAGPVPTLAELVRDGVLPHSPNGVLGDPAGASAEQGRTLLDTLVEDLCRML